MIALGHMRAPLSEKAGRFAKFCAVGAIGFLVDAALLLFVTRSHLAGPILGRLVSFSVAVFVTFELNRRWTFQKDAAPSSYGQAFLSYVAVQAVGFGSNFAVYAICLALLPAQLDYPVLCLAIASGAALTVNFFGLSALVFRDRGSSIEPAPLCRTPPA